MGVDKDGYYSLKEIVGYNCKYNIVLSDRGRGKSYGTKLFLMRQEGTFMCLYRTQPDLESACESWLDTLYENGYNPDDFTWEEYKYGKMLLWCDQPKGYFRCLTLVNHIKQEKFPDDLNWVWLDEFIPLVYKKLAGVSSEGDAIRAIVKTIEHDSIHSREEKGLKPVRVLMYANPFTADNPILQYFHVNLQQGKYGVWRVTKGIAVEYLAPLEEKKPVTDSEKVEAFLGTEVHRNTGWMDEAHYIQQVPANSNLISSWRFDDVFFHVYYSPSNCKTYIKSATAHKGKRRKSFALDKREDEQSSSMRKAIVAHIQNGDYLYDTLNTKHMLKDCVLNKR